jgi:tetratricopeptide (TPR) repeat protein
MPLLEKTAIGLLLRVTILAGLILFVITCGTLTVFYLIERSNTRITRQQESFSRSLREYDNLAREITGTEREFERLNRELDRLERAAISVESWLSILKRRRALARIHPPFMENYRTSAGNALAAYPMSQPLTAIASELLVRNTAITSETEEALRGQLALLTDPSFNALRLYLHILLGDFRSPQRAALVPSELSSGGIQTVAMNLAILGILRGDIRGATADIQTMLHSFPPSVELLRLAAEFYYDFGDLQRSAEIFSMINDENAMSRGADALYLAGYLDSARSIWAMLADFDNERSLYNLALTSQEYEEAALYFNRLINIDLSSGSDIRQFGLIHYSRQLEGAQAINLLTGTERFTPGNYPFIDLELCRRQAQGWLVERQIAEAWLLLDRHDENKDLYEWAAWLFLFQRNFSEMRILINRMDMLQFTEYWVSVYKAIQLMFEGDIDAAQDLLQSIPAEQAQWAAFANLGRIFEAHRSPARALEQYELAAAKAQNDKTEARILLRIARCLLALNRSTEAYSVLLLARELDPENLNVRLELARLSS